MRVLKILNAKNISSRLSVSKRKVLVIGPSHIAAVMNLMRSGFKIPDVEFHIYGIHGPAFTDESLLIIEDDLIHFRTVFSESCEHRWFSNMQVSLPLDLKTFSAVFLLDPLFIIGGFMRWSLWVEGKGICLEFLPQNLVQIGERLPKEYKPISSAEWLSIYRTWRTGTIKTFEVIRQLSTDIPILLLPPAAPPKRLGTGLYPFYNRQEQAFLGQHFASQYRANFILQPTWTMDEDLQTLDYYHEPAPDPHHPNINFYQSILQCIDYDDFSFVALG
jgi:hypothetical protein